MAKGKQKGAKKGNKGGRSGGKKGKRQYGDDKTLRKALANWGLRIVKVGADGNCLFRSFAEAHCGDQEHHGAYRNACCEYLREQRDVYENFVHIDETSKEKSAFDDGENAWESFEEYVESMAEDACWGSHVELSALCSLYGVTAMVFRGDGNHYELRGYGAEVKDAEKQRCLMISHHDDVHFNTIAMDGDSARPTTLLEVRQLLLGLRAKLPEAKKATKRKDGKTPCKERAEEEEEQRQNHRLSSSHRRGRCRSLPSARFWSFWVGGGSSSGARGSRPRSAGPSSRFAARSAARAGARSEEEEERGAAVQSEGAVLLRRRGRRRSCVMEAMSALGQRVSSARRRLSEVLRSLSPERASRRVSPEGDGAGGQREQQAQAKGERRRGRHPEQEGEEAKRERRGWVQPAEDEDAWRGCASWKSLGEGLGTGGTPDMEVIVI